MESEIIIYKIGKIVRRHWRVCASGIGSVCVCVSVEHGNENHNAGITKLYFCFVFFALSIFFCFVFFSLSFSFFFDRLSLLSLSVARTF